MDPVSRQLIFESKITSACTFAVSSTLLRAFHRWSAKVASLDAAAPVPAVAAIASQADTSRQADASPLTSFRLARNELRNGPLRPTLAVGAIYNRAIEDERPVAEKSSRLEANAQDWQLAARYALAMLQGSGHGATPPPPLSLAAATSVVEAVDQAAAELVAHQRQLEAAQRQAAAACTARAEAERRAEEADGAAWHVQAASSALCAELRQAREAAAASSSEAAALGEEAAELREEAEALRAAFAAAATARTEATEAAEAAEAEVARLRVQLDEERQRSHAASEAAIQGASEVGVLTQQLEQRAVLLAEREERMVDVEARLHDGARRRDERVRTAAVQMLARRADALQRSRLLSRCWQGLVRNTCASVLRADRRRFRVMMQVPGGVADEAVPEPASLLVAAAASPRVAPRPGPP